MARGYFSSRDYGKSGKSGGETTPKNLDFTAKLKFQDSEVIMNKKPLSRVDRGSLKKRSTRGPPASYFNDTFFITETYIKC